MLSCKHYCTVSPSYFETKFREMHEFRMNKFAINAIVIF